MSTPQVSISIRWGRIIAGAILLEIALIILFVPLMTLADISKLAPYAGIATLGLGFLAGRWVAGKVPGALHGTLAGVLATILYLGMCMSGPGGLAQAIAIYGTPLFVIGNGLRIVGCAAGAYFYKV